MPFAIPTAISSSNITTVGDLLVGTGASSVNRLGVGANFQTLIADSNASIGVRWGDDIQVLTLMGASL